MPSPPPAPPRCSNPRLNDHRRPFPPRPLILQWMLSKTRIGDARVAGDAPNISRTNLPVSRRRSATQAAPLFGLRMDLIHPPRFQIQHPSLSRSGVSGNDQQAREREEQKPIELHLAVCLPRVKWGSLCIQERRRCERLQRLRGD